VLQSSDEDCHEAHYIGRLGAKLHLATEFYTLTVTAELSNSQLNQNSFSGTVRWCRAVQQYDKCYSLNPCVSTTQVFERLPGFLVIVIVN